MVARSACASEQCISDYCFYPLILEEREEGNEDDVAAR